MSRSAFAARADGETVASGWVMGNLGAALRSPFHRDCHFLEQLAYVAEDAISIGELPAGGCAAAPAPLPLHSAWGAPCNIVLRYERLHSELNALLTWAGLERAVGMLPAHNVSACSRGLKLDANATHLLSLAWSHDLARLTAPACV